MRVVLLRPYIAGDPGNVAYNSTHVNGVPRNCGAVSTAFQQGAGATVYTSTAPAGGYIGLAGADGNPAAEIEFDAITNGFNPLRGALTIVGNDDGVGFGTSAMALGNWVYSLLTIISLHRNSHTSLSLLLLQVMAFGI